MIEHLKDLILGNAHHIPFLMSAVNGPVKISMQRLIEAAVTAAVLAAIGYIAIIPQLKTKIENAEERMTYQFNEVHKSIDELKLEVRNGDLQAENARERIKDQVERNRSALQQQLNDRNKGR